MLCAGVVVFHDAFQAFAEVFKVNGVFPNLQEFKQNQGSFVLKVQADFAFVSSVPLSDYRFAFQDA
jgi:dihydroorotase